MSKARPRRKEKRERISEITTAAKAVFFKKGYVGSTVEEIAKEADVSKGTIYLYFKTKDELYASLIFIGIEEYAEMLLDFEKEVVGGKYKTGTDVIMRFHDIMIKLYEYDPEALRILQVYQLLDFSKTMDEKVRYKHWAVAKRNIETSVRIVSEAMNQGLLPEMNPVQLWYILWASFLGIVQVEGSRLRMTGKDHVLKTIKSYFTILSQGLDKSAEK